MDLRDGMEEYKAVQQNGKEEKRLAFGTELGCRITTVGNTRIIWPSGNGRQRYYVIHE